MALSDYVGTLLTGPCRLAVPRRRYLKRELQAMFGPTMASEGRGHWLVPCEHLWYPGASQEELDHTEQRLHFELPDALRQLLLISNGAELYCVRYAVSPSSASPSRTNVVPRYHILNTRELPATYEGCWGDFKHAAAREAEYQALAELNYVPFCDVLDGNYLAILRCGPYQDWVIYVPHDYSFYPCDDFTAPAYVRVAESLESWLARVVGSQGWDGYGWKPPPL